MREEILHQIEEVILHVVKDTSLGTSPLLTYPCTSDWSDISFDCNSGLALRRNQRMTSVRFESLQSVKKFGLMLKVLSIMYRLVKTNHFCTKRDIYYQDPSLFGSQHMLDGIVDNISCMLEIPRWQLHVLATSKGCIAGDLMFQDVDNNFIDCSQTQMGIQVPNHVKGLHNIVTNASFILVVEKDATFQKLLQNKVCEKLNPCIIITGKGFPDMNTRMLLKILWDNFSIPILVLVDADPHGIEIMTVYKFGSKALSFESEHLAVPCIKWLGILPSDISRLGVPEKSLIALSKADKVKGEEILSRPYISQYPQWKTEIEQMLESGKKAEIQALDSISDNFLTDVYLPSKIRCSGWL
ncbi:meiotic recombination protein SPO11-like isoform X2 [Ruditapes philippinarum]|uniref:meiotic recombination protein SPO11-like isoform X2 n=1 Tax=Ruditapes philippinarum TaxID=129788 RepID=UPI00295A7FB3|nr:meiotic recombination protein SPO11-like isoform X2 [Ruditapes philippinarum]